VDERTTLDVASIVATDVTTPVPEYENGAGNIARPVMMELCLGVTADGPGGNYGPAA
jgi:hypothetical protein